MDQRLSACSKLLLSKLLTQKLMQYPLPLMLSSWTARCP
uniref:Uncharacterized protein n=1 Tax=Arundo donax TaxID=35708 RepID=A0A0A9C4H5_ARUDO